LGSPHVDNLKKALPMSAWSPSQYLKFADERSRPARDLLAAVPLTQVRRAVDIGCGPGNSTELLVERFPQAEVIGLDSSPEMLAAARQRLPNGSFIEADAATWTPDAVVDLLYANATFQWVPDHQAVLKRLFVALPSGGVLAVQMPDNVATEPSHTLMRAVAAEGRWADKFHQPVARETIGAPTDYYNLLQPAAARIDIWRTVYNHPLANVVAIVDMVRSTGLRPYLARLSADEQGPFLDQYQARLAQAYPPLADGKVLFRFPRLFIVAVRA
jgi:trans-aconitate 2-methyltransferase